MTDLTILGWLSIGLVAGLLARLLAPGRDPGGIIVTVLIGIAGALLAGFVAPAAGLGSSWHSYGAAAAGAIMLLLLYRIILVRRS